MCFIRIDSILKLDLSVHKVYNMFLQNVLPSKHVIYLLQSCREEALSVGH